MSDDIEYLGDIVTKEQIKNYSFNQLIMYLKNLSLDQRQNYLTNPHVLTTLFLLDSRENIWQFEQVMAIYTFNDLLPFMQGAFLSQMKNREDRRSYVYLVTFIRFYKNQFMANIFQNAELVNFFIVEGKNIYSELDFTADFALKILAFMADHKVKGENIFISSLVTNNIKTKEEQTNLLNKIKDDELIIDLLNILDPDVVSKYLITQPLNLTNQEVYNLMLRTRVPASKYENKTFFNRYILNISFPSMEDTLNKLRKNNNVTYFEQLSRNMIEQILALYDPNSELITYQPQTFDYNKEPYEVFITSYYYFFRQLNPKQITKLIIASILIDQLFKDSYHNVCLNINELLSYNQKLAQPLLDSAKVHFYDQILNCDKMTSNELCQLYNQYKNAHISETFYDDMRQMKQKAYQNIQASCLDINQIAKQKNSQLSLNYGVNIYELKGEDFVSLVSCQSPQYGDEAHRLRKCYSLISNNNLKVFNETEIIYGFSHFPVENIIHVFEQDAGSMDTKESISSEYVNRLRTPAELLASGLMNEIQIANIYDANTNSYKRIKPDYIICFDKINPESLTVAQKSNLPIVVIDRKYYQKNTNDFNLSSLATYSYPNYDAIDFENSYEGHKL